MPKVTVEFNLPEENAEHELYMQAGSMHSVLWQISEDIFRGYRKHGYDNPELNELIQDDKVYRAIELLAERYYRLLNEHNVNLD